MRVVCMDEARVAFNVHRSRRALPMLNRDIGAAPFSHVTYAAGRRPLGPYAVVSPTTGLAQRPRLRAREAGAAPSTSLGEGRKGLRRRWSVLEPGRRTLGNADPLAEFAVWMSYARSKSSLHVNRWLLTCPPFPLEGLRRLDTECLARARSASAKFSATIRRARAFRPGVRRESVPGS